MGSLVGGQHNALLDWLATSWWAEGPRVCVIEGFPGVGKTRVAEELSDRLTAAADPPLVVRTECPSSQAGLIDDLLLNLAQEFAEAGEPSLAESLDVQTLHRLLGRRVLLIIDEFQNSFHDRPGHPPKALAGLLADIAGRSQPGRVLLLTSRDVERGRWTERCAVKALAGLAVDDGEVLLAQMLRDEGLGEAVPADRRQDVVKWLGGYPRALRLLVSRLRYEVLDDLIGLEPEAWEVRDRTVSAALLRRVEEALLARAQEGLPDATRRFLRRLAVYRHPVDMQALRAIAEHGTVVEELRDELVARFMIEQRRGLYTMHPVLRDTILAGLEGSARVQAHRTAGDHYARHFRAKQTVGSPARLGGAFVEARYHYTQSGQAETLAEIARLFEQHVRKTMHWTTPVPEAPDELEERITLLSALLQNDGVQALHYYLARLLSKRARPGDARRALHHAERCTGRRTPAGSWVLRIRLEAEQNGPDRALVVARQGIRLIPPNKDLAALYQIAAEMLDHADRIDEAVALLKEGITRVPPEQKLDALYQSAAEMLDRAGRTDDAVALLERGIERVPPEQGLVTLYHNAAEMLDRAGRTDEAVTLLKEGITRVPPDKGLFDLYRSSAEMLDRAGSTDEAVALLKEGIERVPLDSMVASFNVQILQAEGRWREAAEASEAALAAHPTVSQFVLDGAFCWLCAEETSNAHRLFEANARMIRLEPGYSYAWLAAFIALERNDVVAAAGMLALYLGRPLAEGERADKATLLRLWDPHAGRRKGRNLAIDFPTLPASLTGLDASYTRKQYGPSVLPADLEVQLSHRVGKPGTTVGTAAEPTPHPTPWAPWQIMQAMRPAGWSGLYVVGCFDRRITFYAQQVRALTLVRALFECQDLRAGQRVGVIGGGAAGVTAAVAAAARGCQVVLYEEHDAVLDLQAMSNRRYLHPHIYDWPQPGCLRSQAGLPLLDWSAAYAEEVVRDIRDQITRFRGDHPDRLTIKTNSRITSIGPLPGPEGARRVRLIGKKGDIDEDFDVVLVAIGFGAERSPFDKVATPSYWAGDAIDGPFADSGRKQKILISGAGDGGLVDLARATLQGFRHDRAVATLTTNPAVEVLAGQMQAVDERARALRLQGRPEVNLNKEYRGLDIDREIIETVKGMARTDTAVTFNYRGAEVFTLGSALINRLLVLLLLQADLVEREMGSITDIQPSPAAPWRQRVTFDGRAVVTGEHDYDLVILRHGPPRDFFARAFPKLAEACKELGGKLADLGITGTLDPDTDAWYRG